MYIKVSTENISFYKENKTYFKILIVNFQAKFLISL